MKRKTPLNQQMLGKIFMYLHRRACYDNDVVRLRWKRAYGRFHARHLPNNGSINFLNTYTAHRWM